MLKLSVTSQTAMLEHGTSRHVDTFEGKQVSDCKSPVSRKIRRPELNFHLPTGRHEATRPTGSTAKSLAGGIEPYAHAHISLNLSEKL